MKVREYLKKRNIPLPGPGDCPVVFYADNPIVWKLARECCESSGKGDCVEHLLSAEIEPAE